MATAGLFTFDENGNVVFNSNYMIAFKYMGQITVTRSGQTVTDERFLEGTPFAYPINAVISSAASSTKTSDAYATVSGSVMTFYLENTTSATFIYGVY